VAGSPLLERFSPLEVVPGAASLGATPLGANPLAPNSPLTGGTVAAVKTR